MGIGLPLEVISWGSMLSLSEKALLSGAWWIILIPGVFLVVTMLCVTNIGGWLRGEGEQRDMEESASHAPRGHDILAVPQPQYL